jgi:hypothetical protein
MSTEGTPSGPPQAIEAGGSVFTYLAETPARPDRDIAGAVLYRTPDGDTLRLSTHYGSGSGLAQPVMSIRAEAHPAATAEGLLARPFSATAELSVWGRTPAVPDANQGIAAVGQTAGELVQTFGSLPAGEQPSSFQNTEVRSGNTRLAYSGTLEGERIGPGTTLSFRADDSSRFVQIEARPLHPENPTQPDVVIAGRGYPSIAELQQLPRLEAGASVTFRVLQPDLPPGEAQPGYHAQKVLAVGNVTGRALHRYLQLDFVTRKT